MEPSQTSATPATFTPTPRTKVVRHADRAVYDRDQIYAILDEAFVCYVGFAIAGRGQHAPVAEPEGTPGWPPLPAASFEAGQPFVMPTAYGRDGDRIFLHGAAGNRMIRHLATGAPVCVTVSLLDALVLGRSALRHSVNYRSVVILGSATPITDPADKAAALRCLTNHVVPGRWEEVRAPTDKELAATSVVALPLTEASAKVRTGSSMDPEDEWSYPTWAGIVPLVTRPGTPIPHDSLPPGVAPIDTSRFSGRIRQ